MTPLPVNPVIVIFKDKIVTATANNVAPDLKVIICESLEEFDKEAEGKPFVSEHEH